MLYLASTSPRRKALLERLPIDFDVLPVEADERPPRGLPPAQAPLLISRRKAGRAAEEQPDGEILAADTAVVYRDRLLGKPADREEAVRMLNDLSGNSHRIVTGVTLRHAGASASMSCETRVTLRSLDAEEIEAYVDSGLPMDRAGAYGIQDRTFAPVQSTEGCPANVLGLPLCLLPDLFRELDRDLPGSKANRCQPDKTEDCALREDVESCMDAL